MLLILTVLYNKTIASSASIQGIINGAGLLNISGATLLLWDNSPVTLPNEELDYLRNTLHLFEYKHTSENLPLSSIYNAVIKRGLSEPQFKYLVLLDDDSNINKSYFKKVIDAAQENFPLMIPIVKNKGIIRSPMRSYIIKPSVFSSVNAGIIPSKNITAINSGMAISFDFLRSTGFHYDTRLNNYGTDNFFMKFYNSKCTTLYILNYVFDHSLSFFDNPDINRKLQIFSAGKKSFLIIHSKNPFHFILAWLYNFMSSLKNAVKYKSIRFFK